MIKTLFHGTNGDFVEFSNDFLSTDNSNDQYGSGFYFFDEDNINSCPHYGNNIIEVDATINKSIEYDSNYKMPPKVIAKLIKSSPFLKDSLENFGDIKYEGIKNVFIKAVNTYTQSGNFLDILNMIGNDFYSPKTTFYLLAEFTELTGIDCITDLKYGIHVILNKSQIKVIQKFKVKS